jgi:hypothetical protein
MRLAMLALMIVLLQLALYLAYPGARAGVDIYIIFILLATAACGVPLGGVLAVAGGALMDVYSIEMPAFHVFFYLIPVAIGAQLRVHMLTQYRLLGAGIFALLVVGKIILQFTLFVATGRLASPVHLLELNYWPLLATAVLIYAMWPWLVRLFPRPSEVQGRGN